MQNYDSLINYFLVAVARFLIEFGRIWFFLPNAGLSGIPCRILPNIRIFLAESPDIRPYNLALPDIRPNPDFEGIYLLIILKDCPFLNWTTVKFSNKQLDFLWRDVEMNHFVCKLEPVYAKFRKDIGKCRHGSKLGGGKLWKYNFSNNILV